MTHAKAIAATAGVDLVAIADPVPEAALAVQSAYGCDVRTIDQIAEAEDVDAVAVCTPTDTHADLIERFARLGKAIFCEKPVDLSLARVRACLDVVEETGTPLMVGFNRRFDRDFMAVKDAILSGKVGTVEMINIISRDPGAPPAEYIKRSGGIFRDMTIHDFDVARWLLAEEVETVLATGSVLTDPSIEALGDYDSTNTILKTATGKQAVISNSRRATYGYDQRVEVHGSAGLASLGNTHGSTVTVANGAGYTQPPLLDFFMERYAAAYSTEIAAFVRAISDNSEMPATGQDGLMALAIADAAVLSAKDGRAVPLAEILET